MEDFNDHCPELTTKTQNMCFDDTFIYVTAVDKDEFPNSAPFQFTVIGDNEQKWTVEPLNGKLGGQQLPVEKACQCLDQIIINL